MTSQLPVQEGDTLEGKLRVGPLLGQGAMGAVFRAQHLALEHTVAIKFLKGAAKGEPERRFIREARIAIRLKSPHVAKVMDVGVHNGAPYIVMEYLEGEDLEALLNREGPLTVERAVTYVLQACEALAEAHALGVVHRDVKPANLMLTKGAAGSPCIKVLDFGVSKATTPLGVAGTEEGRLTQTTQGLGSPLYMAPEQMNDAVHVDRRADLWSIGIVLYQLLTGTTPWTGKNILQLFGAMVSHPPTPIAEYRPDIPPGLAAIIGQCLERDRTRRWPSLVAFSAALAPYGPASAAVMVDRIASFADLPAVEPARPTEPMPAPGEASAFGWAGPASVERPPLPSVSDALPTTVPARTSVTDPGSIEASAPAGHRRRVRRHDLPRAVLRAAPEPSAPR